MPNFNLPDLVTAIKDGSSSIEVLRAHHETAHNTYRNALTHMEDVNRQIAHFTSTIARLDSIDPGVEIYKRAERKAEMQVKLDQLNSRLPEYAGQVTTAKSDFDAISDELIALTHP